MNDGKAEPTGATARFVRAPQDFAAGAFMVALGAFALWQNRGLDLGTLRAFGPGMLRAMRLLRHGKLLRGTWLDPFARTTERREERALPGEYRAGLEALLSRLSPATHGAICDWAEAAAGIKGFGHVKARNLAAARARMADIAKGISA